MLEAHVKQPAGEPDPFECVVLDVKARAPGFYTAAWRTYYVAGAGTVYLLRAPGQRATQLDDLPDGAVLIALGMLYVYLHFPGPRAPHRPRSE